VQSWRSRAEAGGRELERLRKTAPGATNPAGAFDLYFYIYQLVMHILVDEFNKRFKGPVSRKSPKRSPLTNMTNSPIKLTDLTTVIKGQGPFSGDENALIDHLHQSSGKNSPIMQRLRSNFVR
jgi:hypothetical protein